MTRAHRVALIATVVTVTYLLLFFNILPVPLDAKTAEQILIVVSNEKPSHSIAQAIAFLYVVSPPPLYRSLGGFLFRLDLIVYGRLG